MSGPDRKRRLAVVVLFLGGLLVASVLALRAAGFKPFHIPAESMAPTLDRGDRIIGLMGHPGEVRRGDVVLLRAGEFTYIKRVAGLPGDRLAMNGGVLTLNGRVVAQRYLRSERVEGPMGPTEARRLQERFPGEEAPHEIYDLGPSPVDDIAEQKVAAGHYFVLGDNRDRSADSRVRREEMGVEQVASADLVGRALVHSFGSSRSPGTSLKP